MAEAKKKQKKTEEAEEAEESKEGQPLEQLVLNKKTGKYEIIEAISFWAKELRKVEEHRHLTQVEILELAMTEVLSGKVDQAELEKKIAALPPPKVNGAKSVVDRIKK